MNLWKEYVRPATVSAALQALQSAPGLAMPIAGGSDLLLDLEQGRHVPAHTLVDLTSVVEMTVIETRGDRLFIGAAAPLSRVARDPVVVHNAACLVEACDLIGGPQVRNVATLGGNVAHALPAADGTIALLALGALAEIAGPDGNRQVPLDEVFVGPGKSALKQSEELLVGFYIPLKGANESSCFKRVMRPQGVALPIINLAIWVQRQDAVINTIRICVGPGAPIPWRAEAAELAVTGKPMSDETVKHALDMLLAKAAFRSSPRRASSEYRRHLVATLFKETMATAWNRTL